jgi:hypothetical protein
MERYKAMSAALDRRVVEAPAGLLAECRHDLMRAVYRSDAQAVQPRTSHYWVSMREVMAALAAALMRVRQPVGALALLAIGFLSARFTNVGAKAPAGYLVPDSVTAVRSVQPDASGRVQIALDETRRRVVSGRLDDGNIQRLLLAAARDESNPGVRVESMDILKDFSGSADIRSALLDAVSHDANPGVRLKALEGLKHFAADPVVRQTLAQALVKDENPGVRIQVIDLLTAHRDDSMVGVFQNLVEKENNTYVRLRCAKALKDMNASVGTF